MVSISKTPSPYLSALKLSAQNPNRDTQSRAEKTQADAGTQNALTVDTVSISQEALRAAESAALSVKASYWQKFYAGREGFSTVNLAAAVVDPGAQPFSQNRPFAEVAQAARESIDGRYDAMRASGQPFGHNSSGGRDIYTALGELDRRALYAVSSNEGGLFSKREQDYAVSLMRQQQGNAMGFGSGPTSAFESHADPHLGDHESRFKAMNRFLDSVSIEERATSAEWAQQRASGQRTVERMARERGQEPEPFTTENALLNLLQEAIDARRARIEEEGLENPSDLPQLLDGYEDRIAQALEENRAIFNLS